MASPSNAETFEKIELFKQPVISDKMALMYRIAALVILLTIGTMIMDSYMSGEFTALVNEEWHWLLYIVMVPFLFFAKEIHDGSQLYLKIDFDRKELAISHSRSQKQNISFDSIEDVAFGTGKITLTLKGDTQRIISMTDLLYKDVQKLKLLLYQITTSKSTTTSNARTESN